MVTIKDVAKVAGVSYSTVSRYLNRRSEVQVDTAKKIEAAIKELDYVQDLNASAMRNSKSKVIAVVMPSITDIIFSQVTLEIYKYFREKEYQVVTFYAFDDLETEKEIIKSIRAFRSAAAIFMVEPQGNKAIKHIEDLINSGVKVTTINRFQEIEGAIALNKKLARGVQKSFEYYIDSGYEEIGLVLGWEKQGKTKVILDQVRSLYNDLGKTYDESLVRFCYYKEQYIEDIVKYFLNRGVKALFVNSDMAAVRIIRKLNELGYNAPDAMEVISIGNSEAVDLKGVSSVDIGLTSLGINAAKVTYNQLNPDLLQEQIDYENVEPVLVHRSTTFNKL